MQDNRKITLAITTWNRYEMLLESFAKVINDDRISEICIVDDFSDEETIYKIEQWLEFDAPQKVKLCVNTKNIGVYFNKRMAVLMSDNEYVILFDSDNIMDVDYLDKIFAEQWNEDTILQPDFAKPHFNFQMFSGITVNRHNVSGMVAKDNSILTAFNAQNMFVNRKRYLQIFDESIEPMTSDSIYFSYLWLKNDGKIKFVDGLQYEHRIHNGSHYIQRNKETPKGFHQDIENKIKTLK